MDIRIDDHNNILRDRKVFFPIGIYGIAAGRGLEENVGTGIDFSHPEELQREKLAELVDSGFDFIHSYEFQRGGMGEDFDRYIGRATKQLDWAREHGLGVMMQMSLDPYESGDLSWSRKHVQALRDHPAMMFWYTVDEPAGFYAADLMRQVNNLVKSEDPHHPTISCLCSGYGDFADASDVLMVDPYPVPAKNIKQVTNDTNAIRGACNDGKPVIGVVQAFDWSSHDKGRSPESGRAPTRDELRAMSYLFIVNGAKGLIYFCFYRNVDLPEVWEAQKEVAREIGSIEPIILAPYSGYKVKVEPADGKLEYCVKDHDGKRYLFVVNTDQEPVDAVFTLPNAGKVTSVFGKRNVPVSGGQFRDRFRGFDVRLYEIA